jgi:putative ABC transport system permease protein
MFDLDRWTELADGLRTNPVRTLLTALGVFWGMFMLVVMLGFGDGLERGATRSMAGYATNAVYLWGGRTTLPWGGLAPGRYVGFDNSDTEALRQLPGVEHVAPRNQLGGWREGNNVVRGAKTGNYTVMGDVAELAHILAPIVVRGRFLDPLDVAERRKVAVLGDQVVQELFPYGEDPIGQHVAIRGIQFKVVGWIRSHANDDRSDRDNATIHLPFTTFQRTFGFGDRVGWFALTGAKDVPGSELEANIRRELGDRHQVNPEDNNAIGAFNAEKEFAKITALFTGIRFFVWFVGVMTLAAGVVGVSNILLIVVRERTKEFGLRRALGATPTDVVGMVVQEAIVLTAVAGYAGLVAGVVVLEIAARLIGTDSATMGTPTVDLGAALGAGLVLLIGGALAGVIPARHAAAIQPVVALHAE